MGERHVVVGAGAVGVSTAKELVEQGHDVVLASRSGQGPDIPGVRRAAADVADAGRLIVLADGATALYNCVNPPSYDVWSTYWPPISDAFLTAAERTGAVLVTASSLYAYGPVDVPMIEGMPDAADQTKGRIRARMWAQARELHEAGRIRAVEVRGSDFMGPDIRSAHIPMVAPRALAGKTAWVFGRADVLHAFTDVRDMGRALATVAQQPEAWGQVWHAPTNAARTQSEVIADVCRAVGRPVPRVRPWPSVVLSVGGRMVPLLRELRETEYQFRRPYILDSSAIEREFGLKPTPWDEVCRATAESALGEATARHSRAEAGDIGTG